MSNFAKSFKDELTRLARKEAKAAVAPIRKPAAATRSTLANLKQRLSAMEKDIRRLTKLLSTLSPQRLQPSTLNLQPSPTTASKARITGKGMRSLRRKLNLNAAQLAKLLSVSRYAVYEWEKRNGPLRLRQTTRAAILAIRHLGAREAKARLQALAKK
jgi:DNA-binding transcriptional regulator YiaG